MKKNLSIHSENILPIIKKWLYSEKEIFVRELVSNSCDALNKAKILRDQGHLSARDDEFTIDITLDRKQKSIAISDTGIGMTGEEVEKYIAQIAFSGAEEFVSKYQSATEKDPIIGHFGLGFYSSYMVAKNVEIETLSFAPDATPIHWSCDGSSTYEIGPGRRPHRGTTVTLHLDEDNLEFLEESKLRALLQRHCRFLPFPISLNGVSLGNQSPLWLKSPIDCTDAEYLAFYRSFFPLDPDPLFWIHLNVDYPFRLQGILYFPKLHRRFDVKESSIQLFCNRVFVSDHCADILPDYLMALRGAIDSPDIPLNVSRSYLQVDKNVRQLSAHISKKVSDRLLSLYKTDRETYVRYWPDIETILKLGVLQDEKFYERMKEGLIWKNSRDEWTTCAEYLERNPGSKILYAPQDRIGQIGDVLKEKNIEFLYSTSYIDTALLSILEEKLSCTFERVDGALQETLLDASREKTLLDADGKTAGAKIAAFVRQSLSADNIEVEAKSLASDALPALVVLDEKERRLRDYLALTQGKPMAGLLAKRTFVLNTNNKLVQAIQRLQTHRPETAQQLSRHLYDLTLLSQKELEPSQVEEVIRRQTSLLEQLASCIP
jgi:molecular chaperone HtpG